MSTPQDPYRMGLCRECDQPVYAKVMSSAQAAANPDHVQCPAPGTLTQRYWHVACWQVVSRRSASPRPVRTWRYHTHSSDWAGADGTVEATSADEASRKVDAWVRRQDVLGVDDEMGPYVKITGPVEPAVVK